MPTQRFYHNKKFNRASANYQKGSHEVIKSSKTSLGKLADHEWSDVDVDIGLGKPTYV